MVVRSESGMANLLLYREAVRAGGEEDCFVAENAPRNDRARGEKEVEVVAVIVGLARGVRCSICGLTRTWMP